MFYVEKDGFIISCRYNKEKEHFEGYLADLNMYVFSNTLEGFKRNFDEMLPGYVSDHSKTKLLPDNIIFDKNQFKFYEIVGFDRRMKHLIVRNVCTIMVGQYKGISLRYWNTEYLNSIKDINAALESEKQDLQDLKTNLQDMQGTDELTEKMQEIYEQYDFEDECDIENFCIDRMNLIHRAERELEEFQREGKNE